MANVKINKCLPHIFELAPTVFRDINFFNLLPSKSRSKSRNAIFEITLFDGKCQILQMTPTHFCASSYRFRDKDLLNFYLEKVGQGYEAQFLQLHRSMANVKIYKCLLHILR